MKQAIPEGEWKRIDATVTGKWSGTTVEAENVVKRGETLTAENLHIRHSNVWVPLVEIKATGYKPAEKGAEK